MTEARSARHGEGRYHTVAKKSEDGLCTAQQES